MLKGKSRLNALLDALQNTKDKNGESKWEYRVRKEKDLGRITGLYFVNCRAGRMFTRYLDVVHINATYKVNRFNVPLISIVGTTSLNTTFQIASIFLVGKHKDDYFWALQNLQVIADS